jgi:CDP-glucose 4,6-dehydratase
MESLEMKSFWQDKRVLITGHTGFKGSWLSFWLNQLGAEVFGYSLKPDDDKLLFSQLKLENSINHQIGDISDQTLFSDYLLDCEPDFIFHLAAQSLVLESYVDTPGTWQTNVMGTVNLLESLRKYKSSCNVVIVTTDKVYNNKEWSYGYRENDQLGGLDPYSASKSAVELVTQSYRALFKKQNKSILIASARAGNVIGGGDWCENRLIPDIIRSLISGVSIEVRNPSSIRPWQHVLEPLAGYLCLAESMSKTRMYDEAFNFGPALDGNRTVEDVVKAALRSWPGKYFIKMNNSAHHEANLLKLSIDKAQSKLKWDPKWDFDIAIEKTMEWYKRIHEGVSPISITKAQIELYEKTWK